MDRIPPPADPLHPEIEPYAYGWLDVGDGHTLYYEQCGNPDGSPAVVLHGGPGSGCTPTQRRFFDPAHYRIVLFDQRGCGRSQPPGDIEHNTTWHLVEDMEKLRAHLGISRWLVFGGSWGSTLALAYASRHAHAIRAMVLRGIFLSRASELDWFLQGVRHFFPASWERLVAPLLPEERLDIMPAYARRVFAGDVAAARDWNAFEESIMSLLPPAPSGDAVDDARTLARARVQLHFLIAHCFLEQEPLLSAVDRFRHVPSVIIQGRYDMVCPPCSAFDLQRAWPEAKLIMIPDAGHAAFEPGIRAALVRATASFQESSLA